MIYQPLVILISKLARGVEMSVVSYHPEAVCSWFKLTEQVLGIGGYPFERNMAKTSK